MTCVALLWAAVAWCHFGDTLPSVASPLVSTRPEARKTLSPATSAPTDASAEIGRCWVIDPGAESAQIRVVIEFAINDDGGPAKDSISLVEASDGSAEAVELAFQSARRAIIRCGRSGVFRGALAEGHQTVQMTFDPTTMRLR